MLLRHQLLFLNSDADIRIEAPHTTLYEPIMLWFDKGLPCVHARQLQVDKDYVNAGLPFYHDRKKHRVRLKLPKLAITKHQSLPRLIDLQLYFLQYHAVNLPALPTAIYLYGSFLFHYLSHQPFVNAQSDIDLLFDYTGYSLAELVQWTQTLNATFNRKIDGEVRFQGIGDISLQELLNRSAPTLLCKKSDKVELLPRSKLYEYYPTL